MWDLFNSSLQLLLKGKLFREPLTALRQWSIGFLASLFAMVLLVKLGMPLGVAVLLVAMAAGLLQPYLFKNLKYA
jgi:hypothetical protein